MTYQYWQNTNPSKDNYSKLFRNAPDDVRQRSEDLHCLHPVFNSKLHKNMIIYYVLSRTSLKRGRHHCLETLIVNQVFLFIVFISKESGNTFTMKKFSICQLHSNFPRNVILPLFYSKYTFFQFVVNLSKYFDRFWHIVSTHWTRLKLF